MSINDIITVIKEKCQQGELFPIEPLLATDPIVRGLYVSAEIHKMLNEYEAQSRAWGTARAIMDDFVSGKLVSVGHKKPSKIGFLEDGVWEFRPSRPRPSIRLLGQFAEKDLFVVLIWGYRKELEGKNSIAWKNIIRNCKTEWKKIFYPYPPLTRGNYDDYISNIILS